MAEKKSLAWYNRKIYFDYRLVSEKSDNDCQTAFVRVETNNHAELQAVAPASLYPVFPWGIYSCSQMGYAFKTSS